MAGYGGGFSHAHEQADEEAEAEAGGWSWLTGRLHHRRHPAEGQHEYSYEQLAAELAKVRWVREGCGWGAGGVGCGVGWSGEVDIGESHPLSQTLTASFPPLRRRA